MTAADTFAPLIVDVATELLGKPDQRTGNGTVLRWGSRGSFKLDTGGTWFDHEAKEGGGTLDLVMRECGCDKHGALSWMEEKGFLKPRDRSEPARYLYRNADGQLLYAKVRVDKPDRKYEYQHLSGDTWRAGRGGVGAVPYRLPELLAAPAEAVLYMAEGEKHADKLASWGLLATSLKDWRAEYREHVALRTVVILPDNDEGGRTQAADAARLIEQAGGRPVIVELPGLPHKGDIMDWRGDRAGLERLVEMAKAGEPILNDNTEDERSDRYNEIKSRLLHLAAIEPVLSISYLVKSWLSAGGYSIIYGPSNAGKTFVALDMAMHVAAGKEWRGCKVNGGPVFYIAAEGGSGVLNRLAAFRIEHPDMAGADFTLLPIGVDLHGSGDAAIIIELLRGTEPALIVVDTLARSMGEGDENTAKDAGMFIRNCDLIREATGAHVAVIHHTGKEEDRGGRGSSAYRAAADTEILIANYRISSKKQRDMPAPADLHYKLRTVTLGHDADGDPVTSAVVDPADDPPITRKPLKGKDEVAMTALAEALREHGRGDLGSDYPTGCAAVAIEHWRDACAVHGLTTGASDAAARMAFKRAKDKLMDMDEVREFGGYVWKVRDHA